MFLGHPRTTVIGVQRLGYRPALDGLRGVAILLVVGKHAFDWPKEGGLGVDLFFVLSGFLITSLLLEEQSRRGRVSLRQFYRRRHGLLCRPHRCFSSVDSTISRAAIIKAPTIGSIAS